MTGQVPPPQLEQRFPRWQRLRKRAEFVRVQKHGRKVHLPRALALVHPCPEPGGRRLGLTVTRRVGNAVVRNRIKRLFREAWRREREAVPGGVDVVLIAKGSAVDLTQAEARIHVRILGRKLRHRR